MNRRSSLLRSAAAYPHIVWSILFIIAPMLFVLYYTFTTEAGDFTLDNIVNLANPDYLSIFARSICFAIVATFICLVIAYPLAYFISRMSAQKQRIILLFLMLPMWMNLLIRTYSWMNILEISGIVNTLLGKIGLGPYKMLGNSSAVVLGMVYNFLPYMVMPICTVMGKIDKSLLEAAGDLGCNGLRTLTHVVMPLSVSGVISGITMVFVPSVSTFYISQKMGGGNFDLIGDTIERQFMLNYDYNMGASLSFVLMILIFISLAVMNRFGDEDGGIVV